MAKKWRFSQANAIMADCTYANVLADSLGLSPLTSDAQIVSHLSKVLEENETPYGLLVQTVGAATHTANKLNARCRCFSRDDAVF